AMSVLRGLFGRLVRRLRSERLEERLVLQSAGQKILRAGLAVHESDEVRELRARLEKLVEPGHLAGHRGGREIVHALERDVDLELPLARQRVRHGKRGSRLQ